MTNTNSEILAAITSTGGFAQTHQQGGRLRIAAGTLEVAALDFDADGDTIKLCRLPSNAAIFRLSIQADDLGVDEADLGLLNIDGTAALTTAYINDIDLDTGATAMTDFAFAGTNATRDITNVGDQLWEDAGATSDPGGQYDVAFTRVGTTGTEVGGTISFIIHYVVD